MGVYNHTRNANYVFVTAFLVKTIYKENGWEGVSRFYNKKYRKKRIVRKIYNICPSFVKKLARKVLGK